MSKKHKEPKFGLETIMRLGVFVVLIFLAIGFLSNSKSNLSIPTNIPYIGNFSPQLEYGQKWLEQEYLKAKEQAINQIFDRIKLTIIK